MVIPPRLKKSRYYDKLRRVKNDLKDDVRSLKYQVSSNVKLLNGVNLKKHLKRQKTMAESEKKELYESILNKNASLVDLYPFKNNSPLVSIIILNRNGIKHLKRLFTDFEENVQYPAYEFIVVDNASTDKSIDFLEDRSDDLHIKIIKNTENESFAKATNHAAKIAEGEYLLLLNNDVEPTYGWLNQMMQTTLKSDDVGAVGAKLVYPDCSKSHHNKNNSFKIQHIGVAFKEESGFIKPYNMNKTELFGDEEHDELRAAVTAAALLVPKDKYWQVNGMDEKYIYGYEDVDFCLKLLKKGYKNIYCPKALLFHYEFGTQEKNKNKEVRNRRLNNQKVFRQKWNKWIRNELLMDKLNNDLLFSEKPLKVAFAVTETGKDSSAGDYLTALTFGESLKKLGWEISFLSRRGHGDWYEVEEDVDVLISMLDAYNTSKIRSTNNLLIKIAWPRNWINRWISHPNFKGYNLVFAPSKTACNYIEDKTGIKTFLLPIATNPTRFNTKIPENEELKCDYCFTGSYWNDPREIIEMLDPESLPYNFKLYGENWDKIDKFKKYSQGFINYSKIPEVYRSTKIVVDDANRVTKRYGSVNSRVYDALASGALVITNGEIGANETFKGKLPVYRTKEELNSLIEYYMSHEDERQAKIKQLQKFVLENHTYDHRAETLKAVLKKHILKTKIAIKIPAPNWEEVHEWGDYHMALGLKKELEKENCDVILQMLPEWDGDGDARCDAVMVLRGLNSYQPKNQHFNMMWNISHPDDVSIKEYNEYDHVFIASEIWAEKIREKTDVPVEVMLQCTDPKLFYPDHDNDYKHELLFVGNSKKVYRRIIKDLLPTDKDLAVYGTNWKEIIPEKYIKGEHIPNRELRKAYSSCKILLNDHWDDMREKGFISNRLFDGFAAGAFIISDSIQGAEKVFGNALVTYNTPEELNSLIETYLNNENGRTKKAETGHDIVIKNHTFQKRVEHILEILNKNLS
jgi:O-antigen biosynthesis protein